MPSPEFTCPREQRLLRSCLGDPAYELLAGRCRRAHERNPGPLLLHEAVAVRAYTDKKIEYYRRLNLDLRRNRTSLEQKEFARLLDQALDKLPAYDGLAFRGVSLHSAQLAVITHNNHYSVGSVFTWRAFSSASMLLSKAYGANVYFALRSTTGRVLGNYSAARSEREILFKRNSRFRVLSRSRVRSGLWFFDVEEAFDGS